MIKRDIIKYNNFFCKVLLIEAEKGKSFFKYMYMYACTYLYRKKFCSSLLHGDLIESEV